MGKPVFIQTFEGQEFFFYRGSNSFIAIGINKNRYVDNFTIATLSGQFVGYELPHPEIYGEFVFGKGSMSKLIDSYFYIDGYIGAQTSGVAFTIGIPHTTRKMGYWHTINLKAFITQHFGRRRFGKPNIDLSVVILFDENLIIFPYAGSQ